MKSKQSSDHVSLETQLKRLEEIANLLDRGELPIDEQLRIYEEGMKLAQTCREYLERAKLAVEQLNSPAA